MLQRGLALLRVLSELGPARCNVIARRMGIARTTAYRLALTLSQIGYVERDATTGVFRLTPMVLRLSHGFDQRAEAIARIRPLLHARASLMRWPMIVTTFEWPDMVIQESTDLSSGLAVQVLPIGTPVPVLTSASGRMYLARLAPNERGALLDYLWPRHQREPDADWPSRAALECELARIAERGHATAVRPQRVAAQGSIAVALEQDGRVSASLAVRFSLKALPFAAAEATLLPLLNRIASDASG